MCQLNYPFTAYSWVLVSDVIAIKNVDKSVFDSKETGIPKEISCFFELDDMQASEKRFVQLAWNKVAYEGYFYKDPSTSHRLKLRWKNDLEEQLHLYFINVVQDIIQGNKIPIYYQPLIEFIKIDSTHYEIILRYTGHKI